MNENKSISFPLSFTYKKIKAIFILKDFFRVFLQMEKYIEILFFPSSCLIIRTGEKTI